MTIRAITIFICLLLFSTSSFGEMYKYRDEKGNLHFTDDITQVPEDQRDQIQSMPSIKTTPDESPPPQSAKPSQAEDNYDIYISPTEVWEDRIESMKHQLDQTKAELEKEYSDLMKKKEQLQSQIPEGGSEKEMRRYEDKIRELNGQIEEYQRKTMDFKKRVDAFNARTNP